jgi:hypothetical protein
MKCRCGDTIPKARVEFLRSTSRVLCCAKCSNEGKQMALMEYGHKTAGTLIRVPNDPEQRRRAMRAFRRSR